MLNELQIVFNILYEKFNLPPPFTITEVKNIQNMYTALGKEKHNFFDMDTTSYRRPGSTTVDYETL